MRSLARLAIFCVFLSIAAAQAAELPRSVPAEKVLNFRVLMSNQDIGAMTVRFDMQGDDLIVDSKVDLTVKVAFITAYTYFLETREVWRDGRLMSMETSTNDNGKKTLVTASQTLGDMMRIDGPPGVILIPGDSFPTSYWNRGLVKARTAVNNQLGEAVALDTTDLGPETLTIRGAPVATQRYHLLGREITESGVILKDPYLDIYLWYDAQDIFAGLAFRYRGFEFRYLRQ
jgi:hypothetical protein